MKTRKLITREARYRETVARVGQSPGMAARKDGAGSGLLSWTLRTFLGLSGLSERGAARHPRIMEEKALEVYDLI